MFWDEAMDAISLVRYQRNFQILKTIFICFYRGIGRASNVSAVNIETSINYL